MSYEGFTPRARMMIILISAGLALINLTGAWYFAAKSGEAMRPTVQEESVIKNMSADISDETYRALLRAHVYAIQSQVKSVTNKQALILVGLGGAFALAAMGFALFLLGADGAFKLEVSDDAKAKLLFTGTAPGLLCFLLAAFLVAVSITRTHDLTIGDFTLTGPSVSPPAKAKCKNETAEGKCISEAMLDRL